MWLSKALILRVIISQLYILHTFMMLMIMRAASLGTFHSDSLRTYGHIYWFYLPFICSGNSSYHSIYSLSCFPVADL